MPERDKDASRRGGAGDRVAAVPKRDKRERASRAKAESSPFHGALHSDPPQDPFRKLFSGSSLKFEF